MKTKNLFPAAADRGAWEKALEIPRNKILRKRMIGEAEIILTQNIPEIPAHLFMEYVRNGNRHKYEALYFQRRQNLNILALAEAMEYRGRFLDAIIDYLWAITSEHTWAFPAHVPFTGDPLPLSDYETVDLFCAETGMLLAQTLNTLEAELSGVSPNLVGIVRRNLLKRIVEPLEIKPLPFWWKDGVNNWTPWVCSNCLGAVQTVLREDRPRMRKIIRTLSRAVDKYIRLYPEDGGCDEGPTYWGVSPAVMLIFFEQLGKWLDSPKIRKMGEYIGDAYLGGGYLAAFADAGVLAETLPWELCYRYGERIGSRGLMRLALEQMDKNIHGRLTAHHALFRDLAAIFWVPAGDAAKEKKRPPVRSGSWYEHTQLLFVKHDGLVLAAKGGHNGENHNHIDIGQFIILYRDKPVVIDLGRAEYTRSTFGETRYDNWILNARAHNIPQFNGISQQPGKEYRTGKVSWRQDRKCCVLEMDLAPAYPAELKLKKCIRTITFDLEKTCIEIRDAWELAGGNHSVLLPLYTPGALKQKNGVWQIQNMELEISSAASELTANADRVELTDTFQQSYWGKHLNRLTVAANSGRKGGYTLKFIPSRRKK